MIIDCKKLMHYEFKLPVVKLISWCQNELISYLISLITINNYNDLTGYTFLNVLNDLSVVRVIGGSDTKEHDHCY